MWAGPTNAQIIGGRYAWGSQLNQDGQVIQFYGAGTLTIIGMFNDYIYNPSWKIAAYNDAVNMRACRLVCIGCVFPNTSPIADPGTLVAGAAGTESVMIQCTGINSANSLMLPIPDAHVMHGGMNVATGLAPVWGYDGSGSYQNGGIKRWIFDADYQTTRSLSDELAAVVSTADGVQHPGVSYVAPSSVSYLAVEVEVVARSAAGACAWWLLRRGFVTSSTSVAPIASTTVVDSHGSNGGAVPAGWSADVTTDGKSNVFAAVQNANGDAVNWTTRLRAVTRT
jgi:hypothetical protein